MRKFDLWGTNWSEFTLVLSILVNHEKLNSVKGVKGKVAIMFFTSRL